MTTRAVATLIVVGTIGLTVLIVVAAIAQSRACTAAGGHGKTIYSSGVDPSTGRYVQTSHTLCLSPDGRILEP